MGIPSGGLDTGAEGLKTAEEQAKFGGQVGVAYDINYHGVHDNIENLNATAWFTNTKAIAHAVATFGQSFRGIRFNDTRFEILERDEDDHKWPSWPWKRSYVRLTTRTNSRRRDLTSQRVRRIPVRPRKMRS